MALTYAEVMQEASVFKYSNEYYEMLKESAEIEIMNQFLEAHQYKEDNADVTQLVESASGGSYFVESVNSDDIVELQESIKAKASNVLHLAVTRIKKVINALVGLIKKQFKIFNQSVKNAKEIASAVNNKPDIVNSMATICGKIAATYRIELFSDNKSTKCDISNTVLNSVNSKDDREALINALSTKKMLVKHSKSDVDPTSLRDLADIAEMIIQIRSPKDFTKLERFMDGTKIPAALAVPVDEGSQSDMIRKYDDIVRKLDGYETPDTSGGDYMNLTKYTSYISSQCAEAMKLIRDLSMFRQNAIKEMMAALSSSGPNKGNSSNSSSGSDDEE